jgi:hypothetical protein
MAKKVRRKKLKKYSPIKDYTPVSANEKNPILLIAKVPFPSAAKNYLKTLKPKIKKAKKIDAPKKELAPSNKELMTIELDPIGDREW